MSTEEGSHARERVGSVVKRLGHVRRGPQRPLDHLEALRHARDDLSDAMNLLVAAARRDGATWADIGRALGISRQAVRQAAIRHQAHEVERRIVADTIRWTGPLAPGQPKVISPAAIRAKRWKWRLRWSRRSDAA